MGLVIWNILTPRFYLALTFSSFLISILILLFEWWYFTKYGVSFIEQILMSIINPIFGNLNAPNSDLIYSEESDASSNINNNQQPNERHIIKGHISLDSKVWRNPLSLFRGSEYNQLTIATKKEPLTFYDMNLSAQDHQTFFTCDGDNQKEDMEIMLTAWRERDPNVRIESAHRAIEKNVDCAPAYILLAEEEAKTIWQAEQILLLALKAAENQCKKSQSISQTSNGGTISEAQNRRDLNVLIYTRRRLAMCARKLGKLRESVKMMRDLIKEFPTINLFNIHENLIEALLEMQAYADVQALLAKYDGNHINDLGCSYPNGFGLLLDINLPKSATICYTAALLKSRSIGEKFSPDTVVKRGLTMAEINAVEAIHRAVEFNPHVPKYLLERKKLIFPPEHVLKRGDSEAIAYAFFHLPHWKRIDGALNLLDCTWKGTFRIIPFPLEKGHLFYPYLTCTECTDRELLPKYHQLSVFPKKSWPFLVRFTASLCILTVAITFMCYQYPVEIFFIVQTIINWLIETFNMIMDQLELMLPNWIGQYISMNC